jgi:serine/threonine protein kinase
MDLVDRLLEKDPTQRLGMLVGGMDDILKHPWFDGIDLGQVRAKKWPAPWKPEQSPEEGALADGLVDKLGLNSIPLPSLDESTLSFGVSFASIVEEVHEDSFEVQDDEEEEVKKKPAKSTKSPSKTKKKSKTITKEDFQFVTPMEERSYQPIRDPRKKSSRYSKEQSKTRRSTISDTLAGMGIDSDDDYQLF